jgi:hypothetical protein
MKFGTFFTGGIVPGTVRAGKAVVADANKAVDTLDITTPKVGGTTVTATAAELNKNAGVTAGTVLASKVVVVDANKDIGSFRIARATRVLEARGAHASISTAGAGSYSAANLLTGKIVRDPNGANRVDTLDSAANIVAAIAGAAVGDELRCMVLNDADAAETITLAVPASGAFGTTNKTQVIAQNAKMEIIIRLTNVTSLSEAYVVYG